MDALDTRDLGLDELEAMRLADVLGHSQAQAATMMNVSQPTFNRILASARRKTAESVVGGLAIRIKAPGPSISVVDSLDLVSAGHSHGRRRRGGIR